MNLTLAQKTLCKLIAHNLFGKQLCITENVDFAEVYKESRLQAVTTLAFENINELAFPDELKEKIESSVSKIVIRNMANLRAHSYLHKLMSENDIPYIVLKGAVSAHYYPNPIARHMGDVDFYIGKNDVARTKQFLLNTGFEIKDYDSDHHIVFHNGSSHYELHYEVSGVPNGKTENDVRKRLDRIIEGSEILADEFVVCNAPNSFFHGLVMLLHMQRHIQSTGIGLRHMCDWAVFVNSFSDEEFLRLFEAFLKEIGLWKFTKIVSLACSMYLGLERKEWMGADTELANEIVDGVFISGNFGKKAPSTSFESMLISNVVKDNKKMNRVEKAFDSMNRIVSSHWPIAKKIPIIYPAGWVYFTARYAYRVKLGKRRKINVAEVYRNSGKRNELYSRLNLFEKE